MDIRVMLKEISRKFDALHAAPLEVSTKPTAVTPIQKVQQQQKYEVQVYSLGKPFASQTFQPQLLL